MPNSTDQKFLLQAISLSKKGPSSDTCFRVGAVLVDSDSKLISEGFTLELGSGWHAEAVAIEKAKTAGLNTQGCTIYTSMEPCSLRKSGLKDCSSLLIDSGIKRVVFALKEPPVFVQCEGIKKLIAAGIEVEQIAQYEKQVLQINQHLFQ